MFARVLSRQVFIFSPVVVVTRQKKGTGKVPLFNCPPSSKLSDVLPLLLFISTHLPGGATNNNFTIKAHWYADILARKKLGNNCYDRNNLRIFTDAF